MKILKMAAVVLLTVLAAACGKQENKEVVALVDQFNGPEFTKEIKDTGVMTSSKAELEGDTVTITFDVLPGLDFNIVGDGFEELCRQAMIPALQLSAAHDSIIARGFDAMAQDKMTLKMVWYTRTTADAQPTAMVATINPADIVNQ